MTNRIFQDEINAAEQEQRAASGQSPAPRPGIPVSGGTPQPSNLPPASIRPGPQGANFGLQGFQIRSTQGISATDAGAIARQLGGGQIDYIRYERQDIMGNSVYRVGTSNGRTQLVTLQNGQIGQPTFFQTGINPPPGASAENLLGAEGRASSLLLNPDGVFGDEPGASGAPSSEAGSASLNYYKDRWGVSLNEWFDNGNITATTYAGLMSNLMGFEGSPTELNNWMNIVSRNVMLPLGDYDPVIGNGNQDGDGGGGGFGYAGPQYVAPDRRVVEDFVKGTMVSLVGTVLDKDLDRIVNLYMKDHRRDFDTRGRQIDPSQSVVEALRKTAEYKSIHELRPKSEDERSWVSQRRAAAAQGGLTVDRQEEFAIEQATAGGDVADVASAAAFEQFNVSGRAPGLLETKFRSAANNLFSGLAR